MKKFYILIPVLFLTLFFLSCTNEEIAPAAACVEGVVVGKIRSAGGGVAVSLNEPMEGAVTWQGEENVVELLNVPVQFTFPGTVIYFQAREAKTGERGPISSDGDESISLILYGSEFSNLGCTGGQ